MFISKSISIRYYDFDCLVIFVLLAQRLSYRLIVASCLIELSFHYVFLICSVSAVVSTRAPDVRQAVEVPDLKAGSAAPSSCAGVYASLLQLRCLPPDYAFCISYMLCLGYNSTR